MPSRNHCCCCPTKEDSGLVDAVSATYSGAMSTAVGMPSDTVIGGGCDPAPYNRYTESSALIDMLSSIIFDYTEVAASTSCAVCCFRFLGRGDYTPDCPTGDPGGKILFGASPFAPKVVGGTVYYQTWTGISAPFGGPPEPIDGVCCPSPSSTPCQAECADSIQWSDGELAAPLPIHGAAEMFICISGEVVTICQTIDMVIPCRTYSGSGECNWSSATGVLPSTLPPCDPYEGSFACSDGDEGCATTGSTIYLTSTQDLSGVAGATIWDKIKAATWVFDYEYVACSCAGGGCSDSISRDVCGCNIFPTCLCLAGDCTNSSSSGGVDVDCLYSVGTVTVAFAAAA